MKQEDKKSRLPYISLKVEVQHVELEQDCLATGSVTGASSTPDVNDWNDTSSNGGDILLN